MRRKATIEILYLTCLLDVACSENEWLSTFGNPYSFENKLSGRHGHVMVELAVEADSFTA